MPQLPGHLLGLVNVQGKDVLRERLLAEVNELLLPIQMELERGAPAQPNRPVVFVLGPPRSGTTLTSQILSASMLFGTVGNFAAKFWLAPAAGLMMARALGVADEEATTSFVSRRGVTVGWAEPSEFGYFWSRFFDLGQTTHSLSPEDRGHFAIEALRRCLASMEMVCRRPLAFKNNTWFTFHADFLSAMFPGSVFVACRRDPFFIAQSLWLQRLDLYGDVTKWWSVRPSNYTELLQLPPIEQVAAQAVSIVKEMEKSLSRVRSGIIVDADYARLARDPAGVLREVCQAAGLDRQAFEHAVQRLPDHFETTDRVRLEYGVAQELRSAVEWWSQREE